MSAEPIRARQALSAACARLRQAEIETADAEARLLLAWAWEFDVKSLSLTLLSDPAVPDDVAQRLEEGLARRAERVPVQHITGRAAFRHLDLAVGPGVFIPRPETELLAQWGIDFLRSRPRGSRRVLDLCTGTSVLALSAASEVGATSATGVELSPSATRWAKANIENHVPLLSRCGSQCAVIQADALQFIPESPVDLVVSNPPYVDRARQPNLPEVDADPEIALYGGGEDGMDFPRALIAHAAEIVVGGGALAVEHAEYQVQQMRAAFADAGFEQVEVHRDYTGRERFTTGFKPHEETHVAAL
ncbi:peptide chain release factor N(5)-glutamine methyltransferase [Brevibacterium sp. HMSC063G07]|uniref:peptide chain release factor N(5)-glutamine methyltransferase n=1 Tax=Brevibacterium sp. HMSC063G07 TaxID=1739261 RepID=UPI0008BD626A|nr:peptide chain release factor N(5)-glutamine methyltransferase [Brevibacterium sp. HMSC063G07]OFL65203.1 hypothetical protein HMPREF2757_04810 [Brevibacterium sp. HMSC063G07]